MRQGESPDSSFWLVWLVEELMFKLATTMKSRRWRLSAAVAVMVGNRPELLQIKKVCDNYRSWKAARQNEQITKGEIEQLHQWVSELERHFDSFTRSPSWKLGNRLVEFLRTLTFRPKKFEPVEVYWAFERYRKYREQLPKSKPSAKKQDETPCGKLSSPKASAKGNDVPLFGSMNVFVAEQLRQRKRALAMEKRALGKPLTVTEEEMLVEQTLPVFSRRLKERRTPPSTIAFLTVANDRFFPGLEALLLSLLDVYPDFDSDFYVYHDNTLSPFAQSLLRNIYPKLVFVHDPLDWLSDIPSDSANRRRIGKLGFMNLNGFKYEQYDRVIVLDSDILVLDDISRLWDGNDEVFYVCYDCGHREYVAKSKATGDFIINSGVVSIPKKYLGRRWFEEIAAIANDFSPCCPLLDRFADQRVWNIFLADKPKEIIELDYNCNIKYLVQFLDGNADGISIVHFAGAKPWFDKEFIHESLIPEQGKSAGITYHRFWREHYRRLRYRSRLRQYSAYSPTRRSGPVKSDAFHAAGRTCIMIGNGPSIANTPLHALSRFERFCFNWFILHEQFDELAPEHLVLGSHMFFGGWNTQSPAFPEGYLDRLFQLRHKPVLWTSFYFKPLIESLGLHKEFECNYALFEKPFKRFIDRTGNTEFDLHGFLDDCRTGVLSLGVPVAVHLGFRRIVLVGCDSNYNRTNGDSNYFYKQDKHTSASTRSESLSATWGERGPGQFAYEVAAKALQRKGVVIEDATIGGALRGIPRIPFAAIAEEASVSGAANGSVIRASAASVATSPLDARC